MVSMPVSGRARGVLSVLAAKPALLDTITSFTSSAGTPASKPSTALETIRALCRGLPGLSARLGPPNQAFWRAMVLHHFDFAVDPATTFNVIDHGGYYDVCAKAMRHAEYQYVDEYEAMHDIDDDSDDSDDSSDEDTVAQVCWLSPPLDRLMPAHKPKWSRHPARAPIEAWNAAHPDGHNPPPRNLTNRREEQRFRPTPGVPHSFLEHDMAYWGTLGAYFQPHEYAFLGETRESHRTPKRGPVQVGPAWPADQDAYSLFCDLILLQKLAAFQSKLETWSDGAEAVFACLLGRFDGEIAGVGYEMFRLCGILPHFWSGEIPVSGRWSGLDGPLPSMTPKTTERLMRSVKNEDVNNSYATLEEESLFPICGTRQGDFLLLRRLVYESFSDWRRVHVNEGEYAGPEFFIGKSKHSGRWLGFAGESQYGHEPYEARTIV